MNIRGKKGITLIALVITIIILIILAGVAINLSIGENGLLNRTKEAKQKYEIAQAKEYIELKINECTIEKNGNATLQDIVNYLAEDSNVTYYVALEEVSLVAGEVDVGKPKEIYVVYNTYQFKIEENKNVEFISIVDVDLEGKITIESEVQEYLGKNEEGTYTASILLKTTGEAKIEKIEIQNPDGTVLELEKEELTTAGKDMTIEFDKEYKVVLTTENGHKYTKEIIERTEETIMTAEELASFRDKVNSGLTYEGKTLKLGTDIDLSTVCGENVNGEEISWEPIGYYNSDDDYCYFAGTFDGNNNTIDNLYYNNTNKKGALFYGNNYGKICNLKMSNVNISGAYGTAICCVNKGEIKNIIVGKGSILGVTHASGLVTTNHGCIYKCMNMANVDGGHVGGIVSTASTVGESMIIEECVNNGYIEATGTTAGGIVGRIQNENATVTNCYNLGNITSTRETGGIAGFVNLSTIKVTVNIQNCYSIGSIISNTHRGGIVGNYANATSSTFNISNNYWLSGCGATYGIGRANKNTGCTKFTSSLDNTLLGDAFTDDIQNEDGTWKYNNGYPILKWQLEGNKD